MVRHLSETPRPLRQFNPAIPDGLQQIVDWMMAKDPNQRYQTPERAAQALQVYLTAGNVPADGPEANPNTKQYLTWLADVANGASAPVAATPIVVPVGQETPALRTTEAPAVAATSVPGQPRRVARREQHARSPAPEKIERAPANVTRILPHPPWQRWPWRRR